MRPAAFALLFFLTACDRPASTTQAPVDPKPSASVAIADQDAALPVAAGVVDAGVKTVDRCPPPGPGKTSDDATPILRGGKDDVPALFEWLAPRGVTQSAAVAWYQARFPSWKLDRSTAEDIFGTASCKTLVVGDRSEEAVVCIHTNRNSWMQNRVLILTVRNKQIAPLLDVGLGMNAMDWPDARQLDLALAIDADGKGVDLADRVPDGTILVETVAACRAREAASHGVPSPPIMGYPATLHDCNGAIAQMKQMQADLASGGDAQIKKETREALSFIERTCKDRGRYVWKGDKFVRP